MVVAEWQPSLFAVAGAASQPGVADAEFSTAVRHDLDRGAWLDEVPFWVAGADNLFDEVLEAAPWGSVETRPMYDRMVAVPRLHTGRWADPPARISAMAELLSARYQTDLHAVTANLYRDGSDSVAWHGDRVGRHRAVTVVAILTLGCPRRFLLRPNGGGRSLVFEPGSGDLIVMGGTCQRTYEHSVPKRAHAGPRICVMFREPGGN